MLDAIRHAVATTYRSRIGIPVEWTPQQTDLFFDLVARRLEDQANDLAMALQAGAIRNWEQRHGQPPDYLTTVKLVNTAQQNAVEAIIREAVTDRIRPDQQDHDETTSPPKVSGVPWQNRWRDGRYWTEPSETLEEFVRTVWPPEQFSPMFRVSAAYLLAARAEEGLPLPSGPRHTLAAQLIPAINEDLVAMGHPAEGQNSRP